MIQKFDSEWDLLDFVSFFERILLDFGRFSNITARVVTQKTHRTSHTKRCRSRKRL